MWNRHFDEYGRGVTMLRTGRDRQLIIKGVPFSHRSQVCPLPLSVVRIPMIFIACCTCGPMQVWMLYSGALNDSAGQDDYYNSLLHHYVCVFVLYFAKVDTSSYPSRSSAIVNGPPL
jgi:hypothetical protein